MSNHASTMRSLRTLARVMDDAIRVPGTRFRFGLDALLGLVPGFGDAGTALVAGYAILAAARLGAPPSVLARMAGNILLDTLIGSIPVLGDLFDFGFKANRRNLRLLEQFTAEPARTRGSSRAILVGLALLLILVLVGAIALAVLLARALYHMAVAR